MKTLPPVSRLCCGVLLALVVGCGGADQSTPEQQVVGSWLFTSADGNSGFGAVFKDDGTYTSAILVASSSTSAEAEVEKGTYSATDTQITFTPNEFSCAGPDAIYAAPYKVDGQSLVLTLGSNVVIMAPNTDPASSNGLLQTGCFNAGVFTPQAVAPVSN